MSSTQESVVRELLRLFAAERIADQLDAVAALLAPEATYQPVVPLAEVHRGREAVLAELRDQSSRYKECVCRVTAVASAGGTVFPSQTDTVTMLADLREVVVRVVGVFELDERDRVVAWREYWDNAAVALQIGVPVEAMPTVAAAAGAGR
jgi:limonene-1,2-epoxide hydrolase